MADILLYRVAQSAQGTFGVMVRGGVPISTTCEDPWNNNAHGVSCIPAGFYSCVPYTSPKYSGVWQVSNVPSRDKILIHNGNTIGDTEGCILVGNGFGMLGGKPSVIDSVMTLHRLQDSLPQTFTLEIVDAFG